MDAAVAALSITSLRKQCLVFTHPVTDTGPGYCRPVGEGRRLDGGHPAVFSVSILRAVEGRLVPPGYRHPSLRTATGPKAKVASKKE